MVPPSLQAQDGCGVEDPDSFGQFAPTPTSTPYVPDLAWSTGTKTLICIRVSFSDQALGGSPNADYDDLAETASYYRDYSRGRTDLVPTVTNTYVLQGSTAYYQGLLNANAENFRNVIHQDAVAAANVNMNNYDRIMVHFPHLVWSYGGFADIKWKRIWMNGGFDWRLAAHEIGHTYGCLHANRWQVTDGNPVSPPKPVGTGTPDPGGYADQFDVMGRNWDKGPENDFNEDYKRQLGWITASQVKTVSVTGTYKIYAFDNPASTPNGTTTWLGLKIYKDATYDYWVGYRRNLTTNYTLSNGAYVTKVEKAFVRSLLIDWVQPSPAGTPEYWDAAIPKNSTLVDGAISIKPVGNGVDSGGEWLKVRVVVP